MPQPNDIVFTKAVKSAQTQRGSREMYARVESKSQFPSEIDSRLAEFISRSDSFFLGTASGDGHPYIQHRGGPKGFLKVLDPNTLAFGDVAGNAQYISVGNLDENSSAFIFLIDYPNRRRIKIWGTAEVVEGNDELTNLVTTDEVPERVFLFHVTVWNSNCPKNIQQRWTSEEVGEQIQLLTEQIDDLKKENRQLKNQLSLGNDTDPN